jgi:hypothetical protein
MDGSSNATADRNKVRVRRAAGRARSGMIETFGSKRGRRSRQCDDPGLRRVAAPAPPVVARGRGRRAHQPADGRRRALSEGPTVVRRCCRSCIDFRCATRSTSRRPAPLRRGAPFRTVEGLSVGVRRWRRHAIDRDRAGDIARRLPATSAGLVEPVVDGVLLSRWPAHGARSSRKRVRSEDIEQELRAARQGWHRVVRCFPRRDLPEKYRPAGGAAGEGWRPKCASRWAEGEAGQERRSG